MQEETRDAGCEQGNAWSLHSPLVRTRRRRKDFSRRFDRPYSGVIGFETHYLGFPAAFKGPAEGRGFTPWPSSFAAWPFQAAGGSLAFGLSSNLGKFLGVSGRKAGGSKI